MNKFMSVTIVFFAFLLAPQAAQAQEHVVVCHRGSPCEITLNLGDDLSVVTATTADTSKKSFHLFNEEEKVEIGYKDVPLLVKYGLLPLAGGLAGGGVAALAFPDHYNGPEGSFSFGASAKGVMVGVGAGIALGLIIDLLDG